MIKDSYWIRLHTAYLDDAKFMQLPNEAKWHFIGMYLLAKKADAGGIVASNNNFLEIPDIAYLLHDSESAVAESVSLLLKYKFLMTEDDMLEIVGFDENQEHTQIGEIADKKRMQTRIRVQRHRERIKSEEIEKDKKKEEDKSKEKEIEKEGNALHVTQVTQEGNNQNNSFSLAPSNSSGETQFCRNTRIPLPPKKTREEIEEELPF
jgi:hypothetical protein